VDHYRSLIACQSVRMLSENEVKLYLFAEIKIFFDSGSQLLWSTTGLRYIIH